MGACLSSSSSFSNYDQFIDTAAAAEAEMTLTVTAADGSAPVTVYVRHDDLIRDIRIRAGARDAPLMTVDIGTGHSVRLRDDDTVQKARLENAQYLWVNDEREDERVRKLVLRSSRLTSDVAHNSRGVKQGMLQLIEDDRQLRQQIRKSQRLRSARAFS